MYALGLNVDVPINWCLRHTLSLYCAYPSKATFRTLELPVGLILVAVLAPLLIAVSVTSAEALF